MTDANKEEGVKEVHSKENPLYQEYRKAMGSIEKATTLKDSKSLYMFSRLLNKFRRGFSDEDCQFLCDNFLRSKYHFSTIPVMDISNKVTI